MCLARHAGRWTGLSRAEDRALPRLEAGPLRPDEAETRAATYAGQLAAYREALEAQPLEVRETWIHVALAGVMVGVGATEMSP